mmetsp:Transcript_24004/g.50904  ORF Transcript_24004/g.50904 Transcript_24004/m.50904 type:complete len:217 (-) Transcript_24004:558-1208(-)
MYRERGTPSAATERTDSARFWDESVPQPGRSAILFSISSSSNVTPSPLSLPPKMPNKSEGKRTISSSIKWRSFDLDNPFTSRPAREYAYTIAFTARGWHSSCGPEHRSICPLSSVPSSGNFPSSSLLLHATVGSNASNKPSVLLSKSLSFVFSFFFFFLFAPFFFFFAGEVTKSKDVGDPQAGHVCGISRHIVSLEYSPIPSSSSSSSLSNTRFIT